MGRNALWAQALEQNRRRTEKRMRSRNGGRCCLCVATDLAIEQGWVNENKYDYGENKPNNLPSKAVAKAFGWFCTNPTLKDPQSECITAWATDLNDQKHLAHKEIAKWVRHTFCESKGGKQ